MHRFSRPVLGVLAAALLAGCGHTTHHASPTPKVVYGVKGAPSPASCATQTPAGQGHMGSCAPRLSTEKPKFGTGPPYTSGGGGLFVDVYEGQGYINWAAHQTPAVVKAVENGYDDHQFAHNWAQLRALHRWHSAYTFLRPGDCAAQGRTLVGRINSVGGLDANAGPPVLDAEVPLNSGCVPAAVRAIRAADGWSEVLVYTSPGTWTGGGAAGARLWVADYGSQHPAIFTSPTAWQFSDGVYGPYPHCVAGLCGDEDRDLGGLLRITRGHVHHGHSAGYLRRRDQRHLHKLYRTRQQERVVISRHHCRRRHDRRCRVLLRQGDHVNREIKRLRARGVR